MIKKCVENKNVYYLSLMSRYIRPGDVNNQEYKQILNQYIDKEKE